MLAALDPGVFIVLITAQWSGGSSTGVPPGYNGLCPLQLKSEFCKVLAQQAGNQLRLLGELPSLLALGGITLTSHQPPTHIVEVWTCEPVQGCNHLILAVELTGSSRLPARWMPISRPIWRRSGSQRGFNWAKTTLQPC